MWSPVPDKIGNEPIELAGPEPDEAKMDSYGPIEYNDLNILPPADPTRVVALAHNYRDLIEDDKEEDISEPLVFLKTPSSVIGPGQNIEIPADGSTWVEVEVAFVINKVARNISPTEADRYIRGYTVANDVTTEGVNDRNWHLPRSKARETFCPTGPHLVQGVSTQNLKMTTRVNNEQTQKSTTANRIADEREALALISSLMTLEPGDLVLTGTPAGATDSIVSPDDVATVEIEKLGELSNPVVLNK
jgi:2-keto-4-pentenoate hydratase/2-oxohepta-3-ene-1,7-dioic acid hydratase in catechol pathway